MTTSSSLPDIGSAVIAPPGTPRAGLSVRISGLYLALYLHFGFFTFLPLWLAATGAPPGEIGMLMAIPLMLRLVTVAPFSAWAGRTGRVRNAITVTALGSAALITLLLGQPDHLGRILIVIAFSITWDQIPVLTDAYAVMAVRRDGLDFGRLRVWGSIGAVVSSAAAGWVFDLTGIAALPWLVAALLLLPAIVALLLPSDRRTADVAASAAGNWRQVVGDRTLMRLIVAAALVMASHGVLTSFGAIQWSGRGISTGTIGVIQAVAVSAEIVAFWFGSKLLGQRDPGVMIWMAGCVAILRWLVMAGDPPAAVLLVVQLMQGVTATGAILGTMLVIAKRVPLVSSAAAQGLNAVLLGLALAMTTAGSGLLWQRGAATAYLAMAALAVLAVALAWPRTFRRDDEAASATVPGRSTAFPERS
ncbi:MFS transporter [Sphingomonas sp. KR1UV-12]|uniref:MFS transporter n=1 Tax=Sphingomonas aurea TaxID=3063994 RepID=A0ABT9EJ62_9SPHN|nr:MFS transporter [Sphingomonas sp. KR1UV-12]MDP1026994.1 MFS transporter [Sphingomonas sp. KR1UV-12]